MTRPHFVELLNKVKLKEKSPLTYSSFTNYYYELLLFNLSKKSHNVCFESSDPFQALTNENEVRSGFTNKERDQMTLTNEEKD